MVVVIAPDEGIRQLKLTVPPAASRLVARPRLWAMLDRAADLPVTTIAATAGYGKTTLLADWARTRPAPVAWYTADTSDADLRVFASGIVRAIRAVNPDLGHDVESSIANALVDPAHLAAMLGDDLTAIAKPVVLIVDNAHMAQGERVVQFLNALLRFPPPSLRLILAGQTALPLDIQHLAERGLVGEIGEREIAFTQDEARSFLRDSVGYGRSDAELDAAIALADGWVTALNVLSLAGETVQPLHASPERASGAPGGQRQLATLVDALVDRIVANWDPAFRRLMIALAIPAQVCADLVAAIGLDDGSLRPQRRLHQLSRSGYFLLPADERAEWYRFHGLFRKALLERRCATFQDAEYADILRRIARWHEEHGNIPDAIDALLEAGDASAAADLVAPHLNQTIMLDRWDDTEQWLNRLPEAIVADRPEFLIVRAWIAQTRGQHDALRSLIHAVNRHVQQGTVDPAQLPAIEAELSLFRTVLQTSDPDIRLRTYAEAYEVLRGSDRFGERVVLQSYLPLLGRVDRPAADRIIDRVLLENAARQDTVSQAHLFWVRFAQALMIGTSSGVAHALDVSNQVLAQARRLNMRRGVAFGELAVGSCLLATNQLESAVVHLQRAAENPYTSQLTRVSGATRLARALDAMGRAADADACLQQTLDRLLEVDALDFVNLVRTAQVSLAIRRGDLSRARALVSRLQIEESLIFAIAPEYPLVTKVVLFAQSDDAEETAWADARLAQILDDPAALHWNEQTVQLMVMRALRVARTGYPERSSAILYRAVSRAEQIADLRVFSDLGPAAEAMLAEFLEEYPTWAFLRERVAMLQAERARMGKRADPLGSPVVAPLPAGYAFDEQVTQREQDVLSGLQRRLTNKEIAAELSISPFTVKKHAQNIYAKLGVNSRRQAIQRAIALGLLPPPGSS